MFTISTRNVPTTIQMQKFGNNPGWYLVGLVTEGDSSKALTAPNKIVISQSMEKICDGADSPKTRDELK